jgi:hypothetical protein
MTKETLQKLKKNRGFVLLFAVTIAAILLSIALGVSEIAFKEIKFSTSVKDANDAFFAADVGLECAMIYDKADQTKNIFTGTAPSMKCAGDTISLLGSSPSWSFIVSGLGSRGQSCSKVAVTKNLISGGPNTATILYESSSTATTAGASSLTISPPTGLVDNNVMIAVFNVNIETTTITPPAGWTLIRMINTPLTANASTYWKRASSESGSYTFNFSSSQRASGAIASFSGVATSGNPIDTENGQGNFSSVTAIAPSITTTGNNEAVIFASVDDNSPISSWTPPTGMQEVADSNSPASVTIDYLIKPTAGATGDVTGTCMDNGNNASFLFALIPATISGSSSFSTSVISKGYNNGGGVGTCTLGTNSIEREIDLNY